MTGEEKTALGSGTTSDIGRTIMRLLTCRRWHAFAARRPDLTMPARLRNALFVLFIGGILAYAAGFACYLFARFDLVNLLGDVNIDDSFYYFQIASNLFVPVLFYASAIQGALLFAGAGIREHIVRLHIKLDDDNAGWLLAVPAMPMLVTISNDLRRLAAPQLVATPFTEHRELANQLLRKWKPYENMQRGVIPDDALRSDGVLGIRFYYLPDLKVIDRYGLTDATVARNPVTRPNRESVIAHDR